ncbi:MAG: hypothetical protein R2712_07985 [Vicinamibacterales bacterium]
MDANGQERQLTLLDAGAQAVRFEIGARPVTMRRDEILAVDRVKDRNRDGVIKGALVGAILGGLIDSSVRGGGRFAIRSAVSYAAIGYLFDRAHTAREPLYRAPRP